MTSAATSVLHRQKRVSRARFLIEISLSRKFPKKVAKLFLTMFASWAAYMPIPFSLDKDSRARYLMFGFPVLEMNLAKRATESLRTLAWPSSPNERTKLIASNKIEWSALFLFTFLVMVTSTNIFLTMVSIL
jgi:hypothetical protein